ncbi:unnamed protein product [Vicia faba]|uniref:Uncharacterized protein n=1 Tax=Vicia faba TaxID=3906 RepID=A0AAV1B4Z3_VICFA|nr:unnamed protein product [Vicia faba]
MHNLLEELGRNIVAENTSKDPIKWRRVWFGKQFYDVRLENMNVEAIVLDHEYEDMDAFDEDMDAVIFKDFSNLRFLIIKYVKVSGSLNRLSNELRYIEWSEYPFMYLPSSLF